MSSQVEPEHRARGHFDDDDGEDGLARVPAAAEAHAEEERAPAGERRSLARLLAEDEEEEGPYFLGTSGVDAVRAGDKDDDAVSDRVAADDDDGLVYDGTKLGGDGGAGRKLSNARLCGLSLYWFARSAWWAAFPIILLPLQVLTIVGESYKGTAVGIITLAGAILSLFAYPVIGILSDRTQVKKHHRFLPVGRRMPYVVVGVPLMAITMLIFAFFVHRGVVWMVPYGVVYVSVSLFDSVASAPYLALVPDIVSHDQFGVASGWLGLMSMLGNLLGGGILGLALHEVTTYGAFAFLSILQLACLLGTVFSVSERPDIVDVSALNPVEESFSSVPPPRRRLRRLLDWIGEALRPFKDSNFRWVFWTRFLFTGGFQIMIQFLQFFMRDAVPHPYRFAGLTIEDPEAAVSFFVGMVTFGSIISALLAGYLSDKYGRKIVVYVSGTLMAATPLVMVVTTNFTIMIFSGLVFGLAYGGYVTVDFALASDVLPRSESHATDLGVWHISWVLPTMITPPIAGLMIDLLDPLSDSLGIEHLGYRSIFLLSSALLLIAVILVRQIKTNKVEILGDGEEGLGQEMQRIDRQEAEDGESSFAPS